MEWEKHEEEMEIPKGAGIPGLLRAIGEIVALPRIQQVLIKANGKIEYSFHLRKGDTRNTPAINFDDIMPYAIARNGTVTELQYASSHAASACGQLFKAASDNNMYPVAFVAGSNSAFWAWYEEDTRIKGSSEELFGLPFLRDRMMDDMALLLCTAYKRHGVIADTVHSYKITIPGAVLKRAQK